MLPRDIIEVTNIIQESPLTDEWKSRIGDRPFNGNIQLLIELSEMVSAKGYDIALIRKGLNAPWVLVVDSDIGVVVYDAEPEVVYAVLSDVECSMEWKESHVVACMYELGRMGIHTSKIDLRGLNHGR